MSLQQPANCSHTDVCGEPFIGTLSLEAVQRDVRRTRAEYVRQQIQDSKTIEAGEVFAIANDLANEPYFIVKAIARNQALNAGECVWEAADDSETEFGTIQKGDWVIKIQKFEPVTLGSSFYKLTDKIFVVYVENIVARNVILEPSNGTRASRHTSWDLAQSELKRITTGLADMPDWYDAPDTSGQE